MAKKAFRGICGTGMDIAKIYAAPEPSEQDNDDNPRKPKFSVEINAEQEEIYNRDPQAYNEIVLSAFRGNQDEIKALRAKLDTLDLNIPAPLPKDYDVTDDWITPLQVTCSQLI